MGEQKNERTEKQMNVQIKKVHLSQEQSNKFYNQT